VRVGVVVPAYKEQASIHELVCAIRALGLDSEIVVVDDSPDMQTVDALKRLDQSKLQIVHREKKGGRGSAVIHGLKLLHAMKLDWFVEIDADFSHPPAQIPELLERARSNEIDLLIASRYLPQSRILNWPLSRRIFSFASNQLARAVLGVPIHDYTNGFRVYSPKAAAVIVTECGRLGVGFIALSEILVNVYYRGLKVAEVPTKFVNRVRGESSLSSAEIMNALRGLVRIRDLKKRLMRDGRQGEDGRVETRNHR
jgi:dolichol-phosphate mannosyltransferase